MTDKKHLILFCAFLGLATGLIAFSFLGKWDGGVFKEKKTGTKESVAIQESFFKGVNYFVVKSNLPFLSLDSSELVISHESGKTAFFSPVGLVYTKDREIVRYKAKSGVYQQKESRLELKDNVSLNLKNSDALSDHMEYNLREDRVKLLGNVKASSLFELEGDYVEMISDRAFLWPKDQKSQFLGKVKGKIKRKRVYEENLEFASEVVLMNLARGRVELVDNVSIKKQQLRANAHRGEILLENYNKKLKYFSLYDDVKVVEKVMLGGKSFQRKAFSEKLEGQMSENLIVLTGYPKVFQFKDVIKGNKIVLRENNEVVEVDDANTSFKIR